MLGLFSLCCQAEEQGGATVEYTASQVSTDAGPLIGAKGEAAVSAPAIREEKKEVPPPTEESNLAPPPKDTYDLPKEVKQQEEVKRTDDEKVIVVNVQKTEAVKTLGLDLGHRKTEFLTVKSVLKDGLVSEWNARNGDEVKAGDQIFEINGRAGAEQMLEAIKACGVGMNLNIKLRRKANP
eukprot:gb/GFBE01082519.1/.p1 GENE.gb/GFBE01082519.1/~~gb/GFBE01082519.1/.p1  ORF type:complete len:181 (+),score=61.43 gb/GFBE01082519.1/:1-543(+)